MFYWILTSHIMAILPIGMLIVSFYKYRHYESLFTLINLIFTVYASICYHTYNYDAIVDPHNNTYDSWIIMDHWLSSTTIIITNLYCFKTRTPIFYIVANSSNIIVLYLKLSKTILTYNLFVFLVLTTTLLLKFRIFIQYARHYYFRLLLTICTGSTAIYAIYIPEELSYSLWHPIWHACIFTTAFLGCSMRHSLDTKLLININEADYIRAAADSL